jgi:hypothetical protein
MPNRKYLSGKWVLMIGAVLVAGLLCLVLNYGYYPQFAR